MHQDVQDLRNFYYRSPLGRAAQKVIRERMLVRMRKGFRLGGRVPAREQLHER